MVIIVIVGTAVLAVITGKAISSMQFGKEVRSLFSQSKDISDRRFSYADLDGLPEPVQRYFKHVLNEGQPYISYVRLTHNGQFKSDAKKDWMNIEGEQYFTTHKPGFIWKGTTALFTARDMYLSDQGRLVVSLFSLFKIAGGQGEKYDHGELLRWLGESVWFPTNLLPNEDLQWKAIDDRTAELTFNYKGYSLSYQVAFNHSGEIMELQTRRYMGDGNLETWIGKVSNYKEINGIVVPTTIEAIYRLKEGDYPYARFHVTKIEYNTPKRF